MKIEQRGLPHPDDVGHLISCVCGCKFRVYAVELIRANLRNGSGNKWIDCPEPFCGRRNIVNTTELDPNYDYVNIAHSMMGNP